MENVVKMGFPPVYDDNSRVLILGSFPSVKSREIEFYYGNKQNRFWRVLSEIANERILETTEGKKEFLLRRGIALWDMVTECEIVGSQDASIKNAKTADLTEIFAVADIRKILLNGALAYRLFAEKYAEISIPYVKLPSTSPANPRFDKRLWEEALCDVL